MLGAFVILLSLIVLYLLSRIFITELYLFLVRLTRSHQRAGYLLAIIFLPGTFIHEISHFLMALLMLVPVGELELMPEMGERGIKLGSVKIAKADFLRSSLIGLAPFIVGVSITFGVIAYMVSSNNLENPAFVLLTIYIIFQITNTMFSSKKDLEPVLELAVLLIIIILLLVIFGVTEPFDYLAHLLSTNSEVINKFSVYLLVPIFIEIILVLLLKKLKK